MEDKTHIETPNLGNFKEYSSKLKSIFQYTGDRESLLYGRLKTAIITGEITVNTVYLPANAKVFSIMFHNKYLSETVIRAIIGEDVKIIDPLVEHRNDILKAIESSIRVDVFLRDEAARIFTLDMQRSYLKKRNRNRNIYYGAKELSCQEVTDCRYEKLKQVSIIFIFEENTTPQVPPVAKVQLTDVNTKRIYSDLITLYEINLNRITSNDEQDLPEDLVIVKTFLSIKTHDELCSFVDTYDTTFSRRLISEYMSAIIDDKLLLKVEGSEKFMIKLSEEVLFEERAEGRQEGRLEGRLEIARNALKEGAAIEFIKKITGLNESTIRELQAEIAS